MGLFEKIATAECEHKRAATPAGRAQDAYEAGHQFFQIEIPHSEFTAQAAPGMVGGQRRQHSSLGDVLGDIEAEGWRLEHSGFVYVMTGQKSRDRFLASGQDTAVAGQVLGMYLFRRTRKAR